MGKKKKKKGGGGGGGGSDVGVEENVAVNDGGGTDKVVEGEIKEKTTANKEEMMTMISKEGGSITVVLMVNMHCEGCAERVKKSVKGLQGIEKVMVDAENNKLTVVGTKVDPIRIRDRVRSKTHKQVELLSPLPKKSSDQNNKKDNQDKKPKEPQAATVVLKIRLHCDGCIQRIQKAIMRIKGVASVEMEPLKDLVTVRGIMDPKTLPEILKEKLKRMVDVVPPKKDKEPHKDGVGGGGGGGGGGEKKKMEEEMKKVEEEMVEALRMQDASTPQLFSDENPNACSVM